MNKKKVIVIGGGFSSLAAGSYLAKAGFDVLLVEKNATLGGRARVWEKDGFRFDMGPTFYWMPDVFERFFSDFELTPADYYDLIRLDPAYRVYFGKGDYLSVPGSYNNIKNLFDSVEPGSGAALDRFMISASDNYRIAMGDLVYKPGNSPIEIMNWQTLLKSGMFLRSIKHHVASCMSDSRLRKILEFPVLFLGAEPGNTPAFYNFMNHADFQLGTWHPVGGMHRVVEGMVTLAQGLGVQFRTGSAVTGITTRNGLVTGIETDTGFLPCDVLLSGADYHHTESLLARNERQYPEGYWEKRTFAPSALMFYVAFDSKVRNVSHHTLFFDTGFEAHAKAIYRTKVWPEKPLFYASFPAKTDPNAAPPGKDAGIFLVPIAPGIDDSQEIRDAYFDKIMQRFEVLTGQHIRQDILFKRSYCVSDFKADYHAYKGNAYGLANTLRQTHFLRPRIRSKKLPNLYACGQTTLPGPGVPPALISGKIASDLIVKNHLS